MHRHQRVLSGYCPEHVPEDLKSKHLYLVEILTKNCGEGNYCRQDRPSARLCILTREYNPVPQDTISTEKFLNPIGLNHAMFYVSQVGTLTATPDLSTVVWQQAVLPQQREAKYSVCALRVRLSCAPYHKSQRFIMSTFGMPAACTMHTTIACAT